MTVSPSAEGITILGTEITENKKIEEALRETDQRKNEFLAVLSHELRNPLAPIRNSTYILEHCEPGGEQAKRALAVIDRQAAQLAHLVDDLLDVTRITRNKIQLQRQTLELNELVRHTVEDHRTLFDRAVALSGYAMPEDLERASAAGFKRHLAKPPSLEKLGEILNEVP